MPKHCTVSGWGSNDFSPYESDEQVGLGCGTLLCKDERRKRCDEAQSCMIMWPRSHCCGSKEERIKAQEWWIANGRKPYKCCRRMTIQIDVERLKSKKYRRNKEGLCQER